MEQLYCDEKISYIYQPNSLFEFAFKTLVNKRIDLSVLQHIHHKLPRYKVDVEEYFSLYLTEYKTTNCIWYHDSDNYYLQRSFIRKVYLRPIEVLKVTKRYRNRELGWIKPKHVRRLF